MPSTYITQPFGESTLPLVTPERHYCSRFWKHYWNWISISLDAQTDCGADSGNDTGYDGLIVGFIFPSDYHSKTSTTFSDSKKFVI